MATKRVYLGSNGPYLFEDTDLLGDAEFDPAETRKGLVTDGNALVGGVAEVGDLVVGGDDAIWTDTRAFGTIADLIAAVGSNPCVVIIAQQEQISINLTIPSQYDLRFYNNGKLVVDGGVLLTIETTKIQGCGESCFGGAGDILFAAGTICKTGWFDSFYEATLHTFNSDIMLEVDSAFTLGENVSVGPAVTLLWHSPGRAITVDNGFTLTVRKLEAGRYPIFLGGGDVEFQQGTWLRCDWFNSFREAVGMIGPAKVMLQIEGQEIVDASVETDANTVLHILPGASLFANAGVTVTINGKIVAYDSDWQQGDGTFVVLTPWTPVGEDVQDGGIDGGSINPGTLPLDSFPSWFRPIPILTDLPGLPNAEYPEGSLVFLISDGKLYRNVGGVWTAAVQASDIAGEILGSQIAAGSIEAANIAAGAISSFQLADGGVALGNFAAGLRPIMVVSSLPVLPDGNHPPGSVVLLTTDAQLYRTGDGISWTVAVPAVNITGTITSTQIADNSISTPKLQANIIQAQHLQANAVTADKILAGSITANKMAVGAITAGAISAGAITANAIAAGAIVAGKIAAGAVTAGTIAAGAVTANTIAAGAITAATLGVTALSGLTANLGDVYISTTGAIRSGQNKSFTDSNPGFFLGYYNSQYVFKVGDANKYISWDGANFTISGQIIGANNLAAGSIGSHRVLTTSLSTGNTTETLVGNTTSITVISSTRVLVDLYWFVNTNATNTEKDYRARLYRVNPDGGTTLLHTFDVDQQARNQHEVWKYVDDPPEGSVSYRVTGQCIGSGADQWLIRVALGCQILNAQ